MTSLLRVLLVEDIVDEPLPVADSLLRAFLNVKITTVTDWNRFEAILVGTDFDVVLIDARLTWSDPVTVIRSINEQIPGCIQLMIVHPGQQERIPRFQEAGLAGYVLSGADALERLPQRIRAALAAAGRVAKHRVTSGISPDCDEYSRKHCTALLHDISKHEPPRAALTGVGRRAFQEPGRLLKRLTCLAEGAGTARDLKTIFRALLDFVRACAPCNGMLVSLYDPAHQQPYCVYRWQDGQEDVCGVPSLPMPGSCVSQAVCLGQVIVTNARATELPDGTPSTGQSPRERQSSLAIPLSVSGEIIGAFEVRSSTAAAYRGEHITALRMAASLVAVAVHNTQRFTEATRRLNYLRALRQIDMTITTSLDLQLTLDVLLEQAKRQLNVDAAAVLLLSSPGKMLRYAAGRGFRSDLINWLELRLGDGLAGRAALERCRVTIPELKATEVDSWDQSFVRLIADEAFVSYYAVPLLAKGELKGVLELFHRSRLDADTDWLNFMELVAGQAAIAIDNLHLLENLQRSNTQLALTCNATIEGWSRALDLRDRHTEGHSSRVSEVTVRLAEAVGLGGDQLVHVRRGALLHDIGKMGIPDEILLKPGPLNEEEWKIMRLHPAYGYELLMPIPFLRPALNIPYCHHEKWDGTGYPRGLKGEEIPLAARVFAVVDVWDALRSARPYRGVWPEEKVMAYIRSQAGVHFDPKVVDTFLNLDLNI